MNTRELAMLLASDLGVAKAETSFNVKFFNHADANVGVLNSLPRKTKIHLKNRAILQKRGVFTTRWDLISYQVEYSTDE